MSYWVKVSLRLKKKQKTERKLKDVQVQGRLVRGMDKSILRKKWPEVNKAVR